MSAILYYNLSFDNQEGHYTCIHFEKKLKYIYEIDGIKIKKIDEIEFLEKLNKKQVYLLFLEKI